MQYFFGNGNERKGPFSLQEMAGFGLRPDTLVWREGLTQWQRADSLPELLAAQQAIPTASEPPVALRPPLEYHAANARATDGFAVASLVLGIVSLPTWCIYGVGIVPAILAIVFGFVARARIRRSETGGQGIATAGLMLGFISLGLLLFTIAAGVLLFVAMPHKH